MRRRRATQGAKGNRSGSANESPCFTRQRSFPLFRSSSSMKCREQRRLSERCCAILRLTFAVSLCSCNSCCTTATADLYACVCVCDPLSHSLSLSLLLRRSCVTQSSGFSFSCVPVSHVFPLLSPASLSQEQLALSHLSLLDVTADFKGTGCQRVSAFGDRVLLH